MELNAKGRHNPNTDVRSNDVYLSNCGVNDVCRMSNEDRVGSLEKRTMKSGVNHPTRV